MIQSERRNGFGLKFSSTQIPKLARLKNRRFWDSFEASVVPWIRAGLGVPRPLSQSTSHNLALGTRIETQSVDWFPTFGLMESTGGTKPCARVEPLCCDILRVHRE